MGHRAAREAVPESARDGEAHVVAGARQPRARRSDQSLGRDRHVLQGLHGRSDQDRHRGGRRAAQADLRIGMSEVVEASRATALAAPAHGSIRSGRLGALVQRESVFSWLMLTPPVLFLLAFLGYPFFYGVYLSFFRREVAGSASFVGLGNFVILGNDPIFWQAVRNTVLFTAVATLLKASGGFGMALVVNQSFRLKALTRGLRLPPFSPPTVPSRVAGPSVPEPGLGPLHPLL